MKNRWMKLLALLCALLVLAGSALALASPTEGGQPGAAQAVLIARKKKKKTPTPAPSATPAPAQPEGAAEQPEGEALPTVSPVPDGPIIDPQSITDWLFSHDFTLPDNFITKAEARALGWPGGDLWRYAPGMSIGGDRFGNLEGHLPTAKGRQYYECDCWYTGGSRDRYRIVYSNDGLVFYTEDHYNTFVQMFPTAVQTAAP